MWRKPEGRFDCAQAVAQGTRETQEDAVVVDFPVGEDRGFAVLADGMGGHNAGDVAARSIVMQMFAALKFGDEEYGADIDALPFLMTDAVAQANATIRGHVQGNPRLRGMGATALCVAVVEQQARWISVGDSPLFLLRNGKLRKLNESHSLAAELDMMVEAGAMEPEEARYHPDRSVLTSAVTGAPIARVDCPKQGITLEAGDVLLLASDGVETLSDDQLEAVLQRNRKSPSATIVARLMEAVREADNIDQDNVAVSVIKVNHTRAVVKSADIIKPTFRSRRQLKAAE